MANILEIIIKGKDLASTALKNVGDETEKLGDKSKKAAPKTEMMAKAGRALAGAITVGTAMAIGKAALELGKLGANAERVERALGNLAGGAIQAEKYVEAITNASQGAISEVDALQMSTTALTLGVVTNADEMEQLAEIAITLGRAQGLDATTGVADLTHALGRQSPLILDNLGIVMSVSEAQQKYADRLGKSVHELTAYEKQQAFTTEALEKGADIAGQLGGVIDDNAAGVERGTAAWKDMRVEVGTHFAESVGEAGSQTAGFARRIQEYGKYTREAGVNTQSLGSGIGLIGAALGLTNDKMQEFNEEQRETAAASELGRGQMTDYAAMAAGAAGATGDLASNAKDAAPSVEELAKQAAASEEAHRVASEAVGAHAQKTADLAMSMKDASEQQIAKELIGMLDPEEMGAEAFGLAVSGIGTEFGLMDEKSIALATNLPKLATALEEGVVPAENAAEALGWLVDEAEGGEVAFADLLGHFGELPEAISPAKEALGKMPDVLEPVAEMTGGVAAGIHDIGAAAEIAAGQLRDFNAAFSATPSTGSSGGSKTPDRQHGGPVRRRQAYLVGETGPELFVPNTAGRIVPGALSGSGVSASSGGTTVNVRIDSFMASDNTMVDQLANKIAQRVQQRGGYRSAYRRI